jgi:alpha-ketoglutarate-dependent taurine dioxygenase
MTSLEIEGTGRTADPAAEPLSAEVLFDGEDLGAVVQAPPAAPDLADWLAEQGGAVEALAARHPVVLLRGFTAADDAAFARARDALIPEPADYTYRSTPRTAVGEGILTATEYPASEEILLHCENAYQRRWPMRLVFCCRTPAATGGQTPVADIRRVTARLDPALVDEFERRGIRYVRNYQPGFDLDWTTVFQTDDKAEVEAFCRANDIGFEWLDEARLRTWQTCQGVARHPRTGERLWFNQAHLFHVSALDPEMRADMLDIFGPEGLPRDARFGDGAEIDDAQLDAVRAAYLAERRQFDWQAGDVMIVDNMRAAHARRPFTGTRRVLLSMGWMTGAA